MPKVAELAGETERSLEVEHIPRLAPVARAVGCLTKKLGHGFLWERWRAFQLSHNAGYRGDVLQV